MLISVSVSLSVTNTEVWTHVQNKALINEIPAQQITIKPILAWLTTDCIVR